MAVALLAVCISSPAQAQSVSAVRAGLSAPHALREAVARQGPQLKASRRTAPRRNSTATKVTAGAAMGIVGFFTGAFVTWMVRYAAEAPGDGNAAIMTGGVVGAGAGAAFGVWLASR